MDHGRATEMVEILERDLTQRDAYGSLKKDGYKRVCRKMANVRILTASETVTDAKENTRTMLSCMCSYDRRVKADHILRWEGDDYRITGKPRKSENRMDMVITAEALI